MDEDHAEDAGDDTPSHDNERRFMVEKNVLENHKKYIEIHQSCDGNWLWAPCAEICNDTGVSSKNVSSDTQPMRSCFHDSEGVGHWTVLVSVWSCHFSAVDAMVWI